MEDGEEEDVIVGVEGFVRDLEERLLVLLDGLAVAELQLGILDLAGLDSAHLLVESDSQLLEPGQFPPFSQFPHEALDLLVLVLGAEDGLLADFLAPLLVEVVRDAGEAAKLGYEVGGPFPRSSPLPPLELVLDHQ